MTVGTVLVGILLAAMILGSIRSIVKAKKAGKSIHCGGNCDNCGWNCDKGRRSVQGKAK